MISFSEFGGNFNNQSRASNISQLSVSDHGEGDDESLVGTDRGTEDGSLVFYLNNSSLLFCDFIRSEERIFMEIWVTSEVKNSRKSQRIRNKTPRHSFF